MRLRRIFVCLIGVVLAMVPLLAEAVPITTEWGSFSATGLTTFGVYESDDTTPLTTGDLAQLIWVGNNGVIDYPLCGTGLPGGDDELLGVSSVKNDYFPVAQQNRGYVRVVAIAGIEDSDPRIGKSVYIRAWNDVPAVGTEFGDSASYPLTASGTILATRWHMTRTCDPTAVQWTSFGAQAVGTVIRVTWETASEFDTAGFNVLRSDSADGVYVKLNAVLIPAAGGPLQPAAYSYDDSGAMAGGTYYYKLEAVSGGGQVTTIGPVSATLGGGFALFLPLVTR